MDEFRLSPGITPFITDAFLLAFLLLTGLGFLLRGRRGFLEGFLLAAVSVSAVKLWTDWPDLFDDAIAVAALGAALGWSGARLLPGRSGGSPHTLVRVGGGIAAALGLLKVATDFFDPFDLLVAVSAFVAGLGLLLRAPGGSWVRPV